MPPVEYQHITKKQIIAHLLIRASSAPGFQTLSGHLMRGLCFRKALPATTSMYSSPQSQPPPTSANLSKKKIQSEPRDVASLDRDNVYFNQNYWAFAMDVQFPQAGPTRQNTAPKTLKKSIITKRSENNPGSSYSVWQSPGYRLLHKSNSLTYSWGTACNRKSYQGCSEFLRPKDTFPRVPYPKLCSERSR